jgi:hypothetical protein
VLGNLCCGCNILMHNKFSCGHTVLENNLRENSSLSYLLTKPTKQVFKFVRTKTETCALKLETIRGPSALSVYMSNLGCDSRINAKAIRMRKVVKCERFARIGILELHFRLRTPKSANGTLRVVHYHSQVIACGVQVQF